MEIRTQDRSFGASIAEIYERDFVPLLFQPYADIMADRVATLAPARVLEVAAGTGVVTRAMSARLSPDVEIVATDLNQAMLDQAMAVGTRHPVQWRQADAQALPFDDASFDLVVCQFGAMFFPDKPRAFAEARRVLRQGGTFLFTVWGRIEENEVADVVMGALSEQLADDPPTFMRRIPHGYFDPATIAADVRAGGFGEPRIETVDARSRAPSARAAAVAFCEGTPMRPELEMRTDGDLASSTRLAERALSRHFGTGAVDGRMQALFISVTR